MNRPLKLRHFANKVEYEEGERGLVKEGERKLKREDVHFLRIIINPSVHECAHMCTIVYYHVPVRSRWEHSYVYT